LAALVYPEFQSLPKKWDNRGMEFFHLYNTLDKSHYVDEMLEILQQKGDSEGIEFVRRLIFEHLAESSLGSQNFLYKKFIEAVLENSIPHQITVISFNFDFLLHEDFEKNVYFDYLVKFDWIDPNRQKIYAQGNPIKLIKLNGSLDWGICPSCNRLYLYFPHMFRNYYNDKKCFIKCGNPIQPFIIIPHEKYGSIIKPLWSSAENELKHAETVTIIGYSFPDYDKNVVELFSRTLNPYAKLEIVSHSEFKDNIQLKKDAILKRYRRLFPMLKSAIDINLNGFEGYIKDHIG
jgi:hypothetical protein